MSRVREAMEPPTTAGGVTTARDERRCGAALAPPSPAPHTSPASDTAGSHAHPAPHHTHTHQRAGTVTLTLYRGSPRYSTSRSTQTHLSMMRCTSLFVVHHQRLFRYTIIPAMIEQSTTQLHLQYNCTAQNGTPTRGVGDTPTVTVCTPPGAA